MSTGIAATLRDKLLDRPAPPKRDAEFTSLEYEMFPRRSHFVSFLDERNAEQQVEIAKQILLRLAYKSRLAPPNKFLYNLLDTESRMAGTASKSTFNGRDHFVHLVNLYLLGLYVFWYHEPLHRLVRQQFQDLMAVPADASQLERRTIACHRFVIAWRQFVLFHDLGYPWEVSAGLDHAARFLVSFSRAASYWAKDAALFALSQLLALQTLREEEPQVHLRTDLERYIGRPTSQPALFDRPERLFLARWGEAERLPTVAGGALAFLIDTIVPDYERISVLETIRDGRPVASTDPELHRLLPGGSRDRVRDELGDETDRISRFAGTNQLPYGLRTEYRWAHYVLNFEGHFTAFIGALFTGKEQQFRKFLFDFRLGFPSQVSHSDEISFEDHAFAMFYQLLDALDFDEHVEDASAKDLSVSLALSRSELPRLQRRLISEVTDTLQKRLEQRAKDLERRGVSVTTTPLEEYLSELLRGLFNQQALRADVGAQLTSRVKDRIDLKRSLYIFYGSLKGRIRAKFAQPATAFPAATGDAIPDIDLKAFDSFPISGRVADTLAQRDLSGAATIFNYQPPWAPRQPGAVFADHGIASGLLYAQLHDAWKTGFSGRTELDRLIDVRGRVEQQSVSDEERDALSTEVLCAVLLHNLYPTHFQAEADRSFRTKFSKREAFTYLALLCDSLQPWDRKRLFNPATGAVPYSTYADNFNLEVQGDLIRITERGDQLRIEERDAALRGYLNTYLHRASSLVKLQLSEWR